MAGRRKTMLNIVRLVAYVVLLGYAVYFMQETMQDWSDNPVQTIIETLNYPVQNLQFPSITVCHGESNSPLNFGFVEAFFNYIRLKCDITKEGDCNATQAAKKAFSFLLNPIKELFKTEIDRALSNDNRLTLQPSSMLYGIQSDFLSAMKWGNKSMAVAMLEDLERLYDSGSAMGQVDLQRFHDSWAPSIRQSIFEPVDLSTSSVSAVMLQCINDTLPNTGCASLLKRLQKAGMLLDVELEPTGTMLKRFSLEAGGVETTGIPLPLLDEKYKTDDPALRGINQLMVNALRNLLAAGELDKTYKYANMSISLLDLASVLRSENPGALTVPAFNSLVMTLEGRKDISFQPGNFFSYKAAWSSYLNHVSSTHPCDLKAVAFLCSLLTNWLQESMIEVQKIMRYSIPQWNHRQTRADLLKVLFNNSLGFAGDFDFLANGDVQYQLPQGIPVCGFFSNKKIPGEACNHFTPTWTDSGICGTFNALPFGKAFNLSIPGNKVFQQVYSVEEDNKTIFNISGSGQAFSFSMLLDAHQIDSTYTRFKPRQAKFEVGIGSMLNFFNARSGNTISVYGGEKVTLRLVPSEVHASENIRSVPIKNRKCRFSDETDGRISLFNYYTQAGCLFECSLRRAMSYCRCVPYNFPNLANGPLCDSYGAYCFTSMMWFSHSKKEDDCICEADCQEVTFSYSAQSKVMDYFCNDKTSNEYRYVANQMEDFSDMRRKLNNLNGINETTEAEYCNLKVMTDLAFVSVEIATDFISRGRYEEKSTFANKLASVGGTIGLFNGMSFITLVDAIILVAMYVSCTRYRKRTKKSPMNVNFLPMFNGQDKNKARRN